MNATLRIVLASCLLVGLAACASSRERWAEVRFAELSYPNLFRSIADVLASEGFPPAGEDTSEGTLETEWQYGTSVREVRGASRRKVFVVIEEQPATADAQNADVTWIVRLRVAEEVKRKSGLLDRSEHGEWEEYRDNFEDAELLAEKVRALLADHHVSVSARSAGRP